MLSMLGASLGWDASDERFAAMFAWKHDRNPFGPSPTWVAVYDGEVVGVRVLMRWQFARGGTTLRVARAVDTATHPDHRGAGLFRALTLHGIEWLRTDGVDFVFNTPNAQSRPGYLSMGWRDVGRVPVAIRVASPASAARAVRSRVAADHWSLPLDVGVPVDAWLERNRVEWAEPADVRAVATRLDEQFVRWRFGFEPLRYRVLDDGDTAVVVRLRSRGASRELVSAATLRGSPIAADRLVGRTLRAAGADHAIRLGDARPSQRFVTVPMGPRLTWRAVNDLGQPPLHNWQLSMSDIELF
jgi:GNAT superfamily N-acetyltransferase